MKKYFLNIIFVSFLFPAYYSIGDTINIEEHLNHPIEICYGTNNLNTGNIITLGDNIGKITVIGLEIPWWTLNGASSSLEATAANYQADNRISFIQNLDDIGMPYNCEGWAQSCGTESFDIVNDGNAVAMNDYFLFDLFALDNYWHNIIIIDDDMVFRHFISTCEPTFPNVSTLQESIEEILFEMDYIIGDINYDGVLNILDVVFLANGILDGTYDWYSDINQDQIINIQDIILLVNLILT